MAERVSTLRTFIAGKLATENTWPGVILNRAVFDCHLAQRAIAAGADAEKIRWVQPLIGPRWMAAPFTSRVPWRGQIMRHVCAVTVENGQAREARYERAE